MKKAVAARAAAWAAAVGPLHGRHAAGTSHATAPRLPDGPGEEGRGAAPRPTPGTSHAPVLRPALPPAPSVAAPSNLPPSGWGVPSNGVSTLPTFFCPGD
jgi:hypothetical protein